MATFDTSGLDGLIADMRRMGEYSGKVADAMCFAAAEEIRGAWKTVATRKRIRKTGQMIDSINYPHKVTDVGGVKSIDIYPQGKDSRTGVRNATKAFILYHGSSRWKNRQGRTYHWTDEADEMSAQPVQQRLEKMWDDFLETGRVPS